MLSLFKIIIGRLSATCRVPSATRVSTFHLVLGLASEMPKTIYIEILLILSIMNRLNVQY